VSNAPRERAGRLPPVARQYAAWHRALLGVGVAAFVSVLSLALLELVLP
jgi:hypothetical protein